MPLITRVLLAMALIVSAAVPLQAHGGEDHGTPFWPWALLGRFHVLTVHFPIAFIVLMGLTEACRWKKREYTLTPLVFPLAVLGALSAVVAAVMGWAQASSMPMSGREAELLTIHRWVGTTAAVLAVGMAFTCWQLAQSATTRRIRMHRLMIGISVITVSIAGHFGGLLVHGEDYISSALPGPSHSSSPAMPPMKQPSSKATERPSPHPASISDPLATAPHVHGRASDNSTAPVDFARTIAPVLSATCLECHGPQKQKGDLRVDSLQALLTGGTTGPAIVPGKGSESLLIKRVRGLGDDPRMPKKKDALSEETIIALQRWIDQGAPWPANVQVTAP